MRFDFAGCFILETAGTGDGLDRVLARHFGHFRDDRALSAAGDGIEIRPLGRTAARGLLVRDAFGHKLAVTATGTTDGYRVMVERGFSPARCVALVRQIILVRLCGAGIIPVHGGCGIQGGTAFLISGRGGTGKTRCVLSLLNRGGSLVSDEWTLLEGAKASCLDDMVLLCHYDMAEFPEFARLTLIERLRTGLYRMPRARVLFPLMRALRLPLGGKEYARSHFGDTTREARLGTMIFLEKQLTGKTEVTVADPADMARAVFACFRKENDLFFRLFPETAQLTEKRYVDLLTRLLAGTRALFVRIPVNQRYRELDIARL